MFCSICGTEARIMAHIDHKPICFHCLTEKYSDEAPELVDYLIKLGVVHALWQGQQG